MILHEISWVFVNKDNEKAKTYADSAYTLGHTIQFEDGIRRAAHILANLYYLRSDYETAGCYAEEARAIAKKYGQTNNVVRHTSILANVYNQTGKPEEALRLNKESMDLAIELKDTVLIIPLQYNYSLKLKARNQTEEAARLLVRLLDYPLSYYQATMIVQSVCDAYLDLDLADQGLPYCYQAVDFADYEKNKQGFFQINHRLGKHFYEARQLDSARKYFQIILDTRSNDADYAEALVNIGNVDMEEGKLTEALTKANKAISTYQKEERMDRAFGAYHLRADVQAKMKDFRPSVDDYDVALSYDAIPEDRMKVLNNSIQIRMRAGLPVPEEHFVEYSKIKDSLHTQQLSDNSIAVLEEFENDRLRAQEEITRERARVSELTVSRQRYGLLALGFGALALIGGYFVQRRNSRREAALNADLLAKNAEITRQKNSISRLNTHISHTTGNYLKRIINILRNEQKRGLQEERDVSLTNALARQTTAFRRLQTQPRRENYFIDLGKYLEAYAGDLMESFSAEGTPLELNCNIDSMEVPVGLASDLGLILQELTTNSVKYARKEGGYVVTYLDILTEDDGEIRVIYRDGGPDDGEVNPDHYSSALGMALIKDLTADQEGQIIRFGENGNFDYEALFSA
ncbi:hypothetical protein [Neolewinella aurantiaca]|nr:hypothetical protein [Neolewinella aurantiaca]